MRHIHSFKQSSDLGSSLIFPLHYTVEHQRLIIKKSRRFKISGLWILVQLLRLLLLIGFWQVQVAVAEKGHLALLSNDFRVHLTCGILKHQDLNKSIWKVNGSRLISMLKSLSECLSLNHSSCCSAPWAFGCSNASRDQQGGGLASILPGRLIKDMGVKDRPVAACLSHVFYFSLHSLARPLQIFSLSCSSLTPRQALSTLLALQQYKTIYTHIRERSGTDGQSSGLQTFVLIKVGL